MSNEGWWQNLHAPCKWCGHDIKVWQSDWSDGYEGDTPTFCSMMCEWEYIAFRMRHG